MINWLLNWFSSLITVTQEDIDDGCPCDSSLCPVALAMRRRLKDNYIFVDKMVVEIGSGNFYALPEKVKCFIRDFDQGLPVEPISFRVPK